MYGYASIITVLRTRVWGEISRRQEDTQYRLEWQDLDDARHCVFLLWGDRAEGKGKTGGGICVSVVFAFH